MEKQQTDWLADRAGARPDDSAASSDMERLRQDLQAHRRSAESWESACLKSVADLLDGLESARAEQNTLNQRLAGLHTQLEEEAAECEQLRKSLEELERREQDSTAARQERDDLLAAADRASQELIEAQLELTGLKADLAEAETGREEWDAALERVRAGQDELDATLEALEETRRNLTAVSGERDDAQERLADYEGRSDAVVEATARADKLQNECEQHKLSAEQSLVEMCDMRVQLNRLETERDDAIKERRHKIKKILSKVHAALDEAGAPRGEDISYGDRVRWLKSQLES